MNWSELLGHPFWTQIITEEEDAEESEEKNEDDDGSDSLR